MRLLTVQSDLLDYATLFFRTNSGFNFRVRVLIFFVSASAFFLCPPTHFFCVRVLIFLCPPTHFFCVRVLIFLCPHFFSCPCPVSYFDPCLLALINPSTFHTGKLFRLFLLLKLPGLRQLTHSLPDGAVFPRLGPPGVNLQHRIARYVLQIYKILVPDGGGGLRACHSYLFIIKLQHTQIQ